MLVSLMISNGWTPAGMKSLFRSHRHQVGLCYLHDSSCPYRVRCRCRFERF